MKLQQEETKTLKDQIHHPMRTSKMIIKNMQEVFGDVHFFRVAIQHEKKRKSCVLRCGCWKKGRRHYSNSKYRPRSDKSNGMYCCHSENAMAFLLSTYTKNILAYSRDRYHAIPPPHTGTFMPPKPDLVFHHAPYVSDSEDDFEAEIPQNAPSFVQPTKQVKTPRPSVKPVETSIRTGNHKTTIPKPKSHENSRNRKACFVCKSLTYLIKECDYYEKKMAQTPAKNHAQRGNHQQYARMTLLNPQRHVVPTALLTKSKLVPLTAARLVTTAVSQTHVTRPISAKTVVTKPYSPPRRHINCRSSPKASTFPPKVTTAKAPIVNAFKGV
nr:hypothetical protein [Tanacetum cinerariifolium]